MFSFGMDGTHVKLTGLSKADTESRQFLGTHDLRKKITMTNYMQIGEEYSFTPGRFQDGRPFGRKFTSMQGGGFFLTLKQLPREECGKLNFQYAIEQLKNELEKITNLSIEEICKQVGAYGIQFILDEYFENVEKVEDGDIAIYYDSKYPNKPLHAGIYRDSRPNWNSPRGGTIESLPRNYLQPYIFQHDMFFVPDEYGDLIKFFRVKKENQLFNFSIGLPIIPSNCIKQSDDFFTFTKDIDSEEKRKKIDNSSLAGLIKAFPDEHLTIFENMRFVGVCYDYAFGKILKTYYSPLINPGLVNTFIKNNFTQIDQPVAGDLVVYYTQNPRYSVHWGIYCSDGRVESKWGESFGGAIRHSPFFVPTIYGDEIAFFRLNASIEKIALE